MNLRTRIIWIPREMLHVAMGAALVLGVHPAWSANLNFLNDTPMSYMKQPDIDSIKKAAVVALNTKGDGEALHWTNAGTGNGVPIAATLTPGDTAKSGNATCRFVAVELDAKGQSMNLHPRYCRSGGGQWQLQRKQ
ncbi:RT0821/Lpp0805 family surface protein [Paraburkholderia tropica]|uniref:RT0821/Lpp0805 family surface protein n=1 Tax=Paraburkholderia tropica TaxID=92647 RepID=UPI002AB3089E|nr:RT0821/Lpp0805 family surface protein [Paraburkholderia tropica]